MSDLAERLRSTREKLGISIEDAERATKIRRRYIEAIEGGDFERLPDGPPSRGFVKNYARYLGLDADRSLTDFEAEVGVPLVQVTENVPPPPSRQQAQSRYTQLVKLPQLRWKGDIPADEQSELDSMAEPHDGKQTGLGRMVYRRDDPQMTSSSFSLREPRVTASSDVRPFQSGRSPFSLRNLTGGLSNGAVRSPHRMTPMSMNSGEGNNNLLTIGVVIGGLLLIAALFGLVLLPALRNGPQQTAAVAPTPSQSITVSILGDTGVTTQSIALGQTAVMTESAAGLDQSAALTQTADLNAAATADVNTPAAAAPPPNTAAPDAASTASAAAATPEPAVQPIAASGVQLVLDAREHAWVRVSVDGAVVYEGIPQIGPNSSWHGQNTVGIETGNAGAFDVIINNVRLGPPGEHDATVKLTWDASGKVVAN